MKALVVLRDAGELARTMATLRSLDHEVTVAQDMVTACAKATTSIPHVAIIDPALPITQGLELIRAIRALDAPHYIFLWVVARGLPDDQLRRAYEAGCDSELRSLDAMELVPRLGVARRIIARDARKPVPQVPTATEAKPASVLPTPAASSPPSPSPSGGVDLSAMSEAMATGLATFTSLPVTVGATDPSAQVHYATGITLANVEKQISLRVSLGVDPGVAKSLATHMFGESSEELVIDMLGELANLAMGSCKQVAARGAITFTGGLPEPLAPTEFLKFGATSQRVEPFTLVIGDKARIHVRLGLAQVANITITIAKLAEGMVLAKDVYNERGVLVLAAKTRLSATSAERLRNQLPANQPVEVAA